MELKDIIYLDSAATTQTCHEAAEKLRHFAELEYGNPSSSHFFGERSAAAINDARRFFARHFKVQPQQVIFTGSGSEADNLAINGICMAYWLKHQKDMVNGTLKPRVLCLASEHPAVLTTVQNLAELGFDVQTIPVKPNGVADMHAYEELINSDTVLVCVMRVNNIMGAIQPIQEMAELAKKKNPEALFHSDCIQAFGRIDLPHAPSAVDTIALSAHKIEGPKGVGALIALNEKLVAPNSAIRLRPIVVGGSQENGLRSGTQSAGLISAFHVAAERALKKRDEYFSHCKSLRNYFLKRLEEVGMLEEICVNSPEESCLPHILNFSVPGFSPGPLAKLLEDRKILLSTGSACSSKKSSPEAALVAMGLSEDRVDSALRVSFCTDIQEAQIDILVDTLNESLDRICQLMGKKRNCQKKGA